MITLEDLKQKKSAVAIVGLGYVGLPLAVSLSHHYTVIGFDISKDRVEALKKGHDATNEVDDESLAAATVRFSCDPESLREAGVIIVAVPTPIDSHRRPDLTPVVGASRTVGRHMPKGCVVCYESTVYPGVTEDECVPLLEQESGMAFPRDFTVGYSPERINPGDKVHRAASGLFEDIQAVQGRIMHTCTVGAVVEAWRSHATLHRQAGETFSAIIEEIASYLHGFGKAEINIPYTTHAWMARRKD